MFPEDQANVKYNASKFIQGLIYNIFKKNDCIKRV